MGIRLMLSLPLLAQMLVLGGCATSHHRPWGAEATLRPGWSAIGKAAYRAATDKTTWIPLVGAALLHVTGRDETVSDWAANHKPLFGNDADDVSDCLRKVAKVAYAVTAIATPSGDGSGTWAYHKAKGLSVGYAADLATGGLTDFLKEQSDRQRPDGTNRRSFVSGHASSSAVHVGLALRNIEYMPMSATLRSGTHIGLYAIAAGTAWARVEAAKHYPSDVLAGFALGNFVASFANDAFLEPSIGNIRMSLLPVRQGAMVVVSMSY